MVPKTGSHKQSPGAQIENKKSDQTNLISIRTRIVRLDSGFRPYHHKWLDAMGLPTRRIRDQGMFDRCPPSSTCKACPRPRHRGLPYDVRAAPRIAGHCIMYPTSFTFPRTESPSEEDVRYTYVSLLGCDLAVRDAISHTPPVAKCARPRRVPPCSNEVHPPV